MDRSGPLEDSQDSQRIRSLNLRTLLGYKNNIKNNIKNLLSNQLKNYAHFRFKTSKSSLNCQKHSYTQTMLFQITLNYL